MPDCLTPIEIGRLLADSLPPEAKARTDAHLAVCEKCREQVREGQVHGHLVDDIRQAYAEIETDPEYRNAERRPTPLIHASIEGYEVLSEVHRGGQGVVYKAVQQATKRTVALKVLLAGPYASAKQRHRFEREIDLVAGLQHPNIVTVYDSGVTSDRRHYFAMEYVHGEPLNAYLSNRILSIDETLRLFWKICGAVSYAHQRGVIHRDLKPGNIRIDAEGEPHVLDFGLAKAAGPGLQDGAPVTVTGEFMGTLTYASPEQTKGDPNLIDTRTDVYSLGVVLYEMLTGTYPYEVVGEMGDVLSNIAEAEPRIPSTIRRQLNDEVDTIILKALAKEKDRRYQSVEAFARDVSLYLNDDPIDAKRDSTWYVIRKSLRRYRVAAGVAATFVLLLAVFTIALWNMYQNQSLAREAAEAARDEAVEARGESDAVTEYLAKMLASADPGKSGKDVKVRTLLDEASKTIGARFADQPMIEARLRCAMSETYRELGDYEQARRHAEVAAAVLSREKGPDSLDTAVAVHLLAGALYKQGEHAEVEQLYRRGLNIRRRLLGEEHPDTLSSMFGLANALDGQGKHTEAEELFRKTLDSRRRVLGEEHPSTLALMHNLANALDGQGKHAEAEALHRKTLDSNRRVLGEEHPSTLGSISGIARALSEQGQYAEAEQLHRETLAIQRRILGEEHPITLASMHMLAENACRQGLYVEAEKWYRETLDIQRRVFGEAYPDTLASMVGLGIALHRQGKLAEAEVLARRALDTHRLVLGTEHPRTLASTQNLANVLVSQGKYGEAEEQCRMTLAIKRRVYGEEHPRTLRALQNLAVALIKQEQYAEAEELCRKTLDINRRVYGEEHPETLSQMHNLGETLRLQGQYPEAERLHRKTLNLRRRILGEEHPDTLSSTYSLGATVGDQGRYAEVEKLYKATLDVRRRVFGDEDPDTLLWMNSLAVDLHTQGRFADAERIHRENLEILPRVLGPGHPTTLSVLRNLIATLKASGRPEEALPFEAELLLQTKRRAEGSNAGAWDLNSYAWLLLTGEPEDTRDARAAAVLAQRAVQMTKRKDANLLDTLAMALKMTGNLPGAIRTQREALALLPPGASHLRPVLEAHLADYLQAAEPKPADEAQPAGATAGEERATPPNDR